MRKHILIVDDEELFRIIGREWLEEAGYRVTVTADAETGLQTIENGHVDLVIADITLPGMDGLSMLERALEHHPELPSIVITGFLTQDNMLRSLNLGVRGFLTKPFLDGELIRAVERALERTRAERSQVLVNHYLPMIHLGEEILAADHDEVFSKTLATAVQIALLQTGATRGFLAIPRGADGSDLQLATSMGFLAEEQERLMTAVDDLSDLLESREPGSDIVSATLMPNMTSLVVRIQGAGGRFGALVLSRQTAEGTFSEEEQQLAHLLATQAAIAIHHHEAAAAHFDVPDPDRTLNDLAAALLRRESGHPDGQALSRLSGLARDVARRIGCPPQVVRAVRAATVFHNLGKAFLPPSLLEKTDTLTADDWQTLRTYTTLGAERLGRVPALRPAASIVGAQRERWDGTGYPQGLSADAIPKGAQVLAAVSAWGAMTCDRPYRPALTTAEAVQELKAGAGTAFNPEVAAALLAALGDHGG